MRYWETFTQIIFTKTNKLQSLRATGYRVFFIADQNSDFKPYSPEANQKIDQSGKKK